MAEQEKSKKERSIEINSQRTRIFLVVGITVFFIVVIAVFAIANSGKKRQALDVPEYTSAPDSVVSPYIDYYEINTITADGNIIVEKDGIRYLVTPDGRVYKINPDGTIDQEQVSDPYIRASVISDAVLIGQGDERFEDLANELKVGLLTDEEREMFASGFHLNPDQLTEYVQNESVYTLLDYLYEFGDADLSLNTEDEIKELATILHANPEDFYDVYSTGRTSLIEILSIYPHLNINLRVLDNATLTRLAELLRRNTEDLLEQAYKGTLGNYIGDMRSEEEAKENQRQTEIDAIRQALELAGITDQDPEQIYNDLHKKGQTVDEWIQDNYTKAMKAAVGAPMAGIEADDAIIGKTANTHNEPVRQQTQNNQQQQTSQYSDPSFGSLDSMLGDLDRYAQAAYLQSTAEEQQSYGVQNGQKAKSNFIADAQTGTEVINTEMKDNMLCSGSIIKATLITSINTDLPGTISALVNQNVFDTFTYRNLLIPVGSKVFGRYDSDITWGQKRISVVWTEIRRPDGVIIKLNGYQGIDGQGHTGYDGAVQNHVGGIIAATALETALDVGTLAIIDEMGSTSAAGEIARGTLDSVSNVAGKLLDKTINRQPTITIPSGTVISIMTNDNIELPIYARY